MNNLMYNNELEGAKGGTCSLVGEKDVLVGEEEIKKYEELGRGSGTKEERKRNLEERGGTTEERWN